MNRMKHFALCGLLAVAACTSGSSTPPGTNDAGTSPTFDAGGVADAQPPAADATTDGATPATDAGADSPSPDAGTDASTACPIPLDATAQATLRFTADNERLVYLNGVLVEDNSALGWPTVSALPVALRINPTVPNVLAIRGRNTSSQGGPDRGIVVDLSWANTDAGTGDGGSAVILVSDATWRVSATAGDAGLAWTDIAYDDSTWAAAIDQGPNGMAPWGQILGASTAPRWLWFYDSGAAATKPDLEDAYFRRTFYFSVDGQVQNTPGTCP